MIRLEVESSQWECYDCKQLKKRIAELEEVAQDSLIILDRFYNEAFEDNLDFWEDRVRTREKLIRLLKMEVSDVE